MPSTPPSSQKTQSGKTTPFLGSPASSRKVDPPVAGVQQQQQQQQQPPADSFGGDWSVWGSTLPQVDFKPRDLAITSSSQDPGRSTGSTRASTGRFDPNAPPFLYSPTYLPNQPNQDGTGGQAFAPYVMQAPMGDSYNPYEPGTDGPTSPYSSAATSFGALPQSPVMPLGQMAYSSFDGSNPGYWMMGSPAASAAALPGGPEYNAAGGQRQSRDGSIQFARGYPDPPPFSSGYGAQPQYGVTPTGQASGPRSPSFAFGQQRRLSHSGWPQFNNGGAGGHYPAGGRRNHSLGARAGYRMNGQQQPGGGFGGFQPGNGGGHLGLKRSSADGGFAPVIRSETLDNFRSDKSRLWELSEIKGHVVEFTADQFASRWLQQKLESATEEERQWIFDEVLPASFAIQTDVFGNYCIQKLFDFGTPEQRIALAKTMEGFVLPLSLSTYGCRSIQKALEVVTSEQRNTLVLELKDNIMDCVKSSNANHVIQRIVALPEPGLDFVAAFTGRVFELSTHPYGCRVLQRCFEFLPEEKIRPLLTEMHTQTRRLVLDQFGNYVIQFVIEKGLPEDRTRIIGEMKTQIFQMARHKFASNVCEKALVCAPREEREMLIDELLIKPEGSIALLMKDQFGNYVLQRSLRVSEGAQNEALKARVRPHLEQMRSSASQPHSKHLASIERLLADEPAVVEETSPAAEAPTSIVPPVVADLAAVASATSAPSSAPMSRAGSAASLPPSLAPSLSSGASSPVPTPSQSSEQHALGLDGQTKN